MYQEILTLNNLLYSDALHKTVTIRPVFFAPIKENTKGTSFAFINILSIFRPEWYDTIAIINSIMLEEEETKEHLDNQLDIINKETMVYITSNKPPIKGLKKINLSFLEVVLKDSTTVYHYKEKNTYFIVINNIEQEPMVTVNSNQSPIMYNTTLICTLLIPFFKQGVMLPEEEEYFKTLLSYLAQMPTPRQNVPIDVLKIWNSIKTKEVVLNLFNTPTYNIINTLKTTLKPETLEGLYTMNNKQINKSIEETNKKIDDLYKSIARYENDIERLYQTLIEPKGLKEIEHTITLLRKNEAIISINIEPEESYIHLLARVPITIWKDEPRDLYYKVKLKDNPKFFEEQKGLKALYYITLGYGELYVMQDIIIRKDAISKIETGYTHHDNYSYRAFSDYLASNKLIVQQFKAIFNPHTQNMDCVGSYRSHIQKALETKDLLIIIENLLMPVRTINFYDVGVIHLFEDYLKDYKDNKCFVYKGKELNVLEYIKEVEANEKDLGMCTKTTDKN